MEMKIGELIHIKRKEKNITQKQLADFVGVSKASVSKWETGQSYPDISLLPLLAAYFNITIDELLSFRTQLTSTEINTIYAALQKELIELKPEIDQKIRRLIRTYWTCGPFVFQMAVLLLNHLDSLTVFDKMESWLAEIRGLFLHVQELSDNPQLIHHAKVMEASVVLIQEKPEEVIDILGTATPIFLPPELIITSALQMMEKIEEAETVMQTSLFQYTIIMMNVFIQYLPLTYQNEVQFVETAHRAQQFVTVFSIDQYHPLTVLPLYLQIAAGYLSLNREADSLCLLEKFTSLMEQTAFPIELHGDSYFTKVAEWLSEYSNGGQPPKETQLIKLQLIQAVSGPPFDQLSKDKQYQRLLTRLNTLVD
ncbi:helix-turn-helix transcriptional regulator [Enterococcus sp. LJL128]